VYISGTFLSENLHFLINETMGKPKTAIIIGAGPAGLTAAWELLKNTEIKPVVFEMTSDIGGISKTINYKGNHIDIGGHRFFSKSDIVMNWWKEMMPIQGTADSTFEIAYHNDKTSVRLDEPGPDPDKADKVLLIRSRLSRIFYLRSFFNYPVSLSLDTIKNLGIVRMIRILFSYFFAIVAPIKNEITLEDFMINRFGRELYLTFFKDYTEKVWGTKCSDIPAEWGVQRIKGLSITKAVIHAIRKVLNKDKSISQKGIETSLIEQFLYPKFGPGQMWQETARQIQEKGGIVQMNTLVQSLKIADNKVVSVTVFNKLSNSAEEYSGDYFFSTMPVKDLINSIVGDSVPENVIDISNGLQYRDFITVGLLLKKLNIKPRNSRDVITMVPDNWIYVQERDVKVGRIQVFNNWSPYMVRDKDNVWIGLEYFCNEGDSLWNMTDEEFKKFAVKEMSTIDFINEDDVLDSTLIRMPKTYPAYFGSYKYFSEIKDYTDKIENLFLIGRNGMHKYNNADHSMLTAITAVENIIAQKKTKENIWSINTEEEYHEKK
jgi:protoporphyrinogen oxidase